MRRAAHHLMVLFDPRLVVIFVACYIYNTSIGSPLRTLRTRRTDRTSRAHQILWNHWSLESVVRNISNDRVIWEILKSQANRRFCKFFTQFLLLVQVVTSRCCTLHKKNIENNIIPKVEGSSASNLRRFSAEDTGDDIFDVLAKYGRSFESAV